jgi:hypothetical protein
MRKLVGKGQMLIVADENKKMSLVVLVKGQMKIVGAVNETKRTVVDRIPIALATLLVVLRAGILVAPPAVSVVATLAAVDHLVTGDS